MQGRKFILTFDSETSRRQVKSKPIKNRAMDTKPRGEVSD